MTSQQQSRERVAVTCRTSRDRERLSPNFWRIYSRYRERKRGNTRRNRRFKDTAGKRRQRERRIAIARVMKNPTSERGVKNYWVGTGIPMFLAAARRYVEINSDGSLEKRHRWRSAFTFDLLFLRETSRQRRLSVARLQREKRTHRHEYIVRETRIVLTLKSS